MLGAASVDNPMPNHASHQDPLPNVTAACSALAGYLRSIVQPAMKEVAERADKRTLRLHHAFSGNLFLAHTMDYLLNIRAADEGSIQPRSPFVNRFDALYSVPGGRFQNRKFELIDAINNSLKHIELDAKRYPALITRYGTMSFRNLVEEDGLVLCHLHEHRFDYARVVLRPAYRTFEGLDLDDIEDILDFARANSVVGHFNDDDELMASEDPADAIDQLIVHCNPRCEDCGLQEHDCRCAQYVYEGESGGFQSCFRRDFDFDKVMSRISGAYRPGD